MAPEHSAEIQEVLAFVAGLRTALLATVSHLKDLSKLRGTLSQWVGTAQHP